MLILLIRKLPDPALCMKGNAQWAKVATQVPNHCVYQVSIKVTYFLKERQTMQRAVYKYGHICIQGESFCDPIQCDVAGQCEGVPVRFDTASTILECEVNTSNLNSF